MTDPSPVLVRDLMTVGVPTCTPGTSLVDLTRTILERGWEAVIVLDGEEGHALGVVSQLDLVQAYSAPGANELSAEDVMDPVIPKVPPDIPLQAAAQIMQDLGTRALFLMHHAGGIEYPAAFLTYQHLLRHLSARDGSELRDLGISAERQTPLQTFIQRRDRARNKNQKKFSKSGVNTDAN